MSTSKEKCPLCKSKVDDNYGGNKCLNCEQKFHGSCAFNKSMREKPTNRYLRDDLVICPFCLSNRVESLLEPGVNTNHEMLDALELNPDRRGGRKRKTRKARKARKSRKSRKSRKNRK